MTIEVGVDDRKVPVRFLTTYRRADGEPICGEYAFVTELEWFDMDDEQTELIRESWMCTASTRIWASETVPECDRGFRP